MDTPSAPDIRLIEAKQQDLLYVAALAIKERCEELGDYLLAMYGSGSLAWGSESRYGEAGPGMIQMNWDWYYSFNEDFDGPAPDPLEMMIADLFHEAGHAINNELEGEQEWPEGEYDFWGRPQMDYVSWDSYYLAGDCPSLPPAH